ncbi:hypothetical protein EDC01DRAFT_784962 [Geopyxis carbonaria]|nr:hypothetical protein EDC01DRAFT_784962 [Geopyxis carbonaria]
MSRTTKTNDKTAAKIAARQAQAERQRAMGPGAEGMDAAAKRAARKKKAHAALSAARQAGRSAGGACGAGAGRRTRTFPQPVHPEPAQARYLYDKLLLSIRHPQTERPQHRQYHPQYADISLQRPFGMAYSVSSVYASSCF